MPYVTPHGTFFHMPKTGGTWLSRVLSTQFGGVTRGGGHDPAFLFSWDPAWGRPGGRSWPRVGVLRNPWDWYGSLYRFALKTGRESVLREWRAARPNDPPFRGFLYGLTHPYALPTRPSSLGIVFEPAYVEESWHRYLAAGHGLFGFTLSYMFGDKITWGRPSPRWAVDHFLHQETLASDLATFLHTEIELAESLNTTQGVLTENVASAYVDWYDDEMWEWVQGSEAWAISEFSLVAPTARAQDTARR